MKVSKNFLLFYYFYFYFVWDCMKELDCMILGFAIGVLVYLFLSVEGDTGVRWVFYFYVMPKSLFEGGFLIFARDCNTELLFGINVNYKVPRCKYC